MQRALFIADRRPMLANVLRVLSLSWSLPPPHLLAQLGCSSVSRPTSLPPAPAI